jgi:hypothetical protein
VVSAADYYGRNVGVPHRKNPVAPGIEPGPLDLSPGTVTTGPQRRSVKQC